MKKYKKKNYKTHKQEKSPVEIIIHVGTNDLSSDYVVTKNPNNVVQPRKSINLSVFRTLPYI